LFCREILEFGGQSRANGQTLVARGYVADSPLKWLKRAQAALSVGRLGLVGLEKLFKLFQLKKWPKRGKLS